MSKLIFGLAAVSFLMVAIAPAKAGCPPGTAYDCYPLPNGKMSCGCR
jgi:hypothetical protein